MKRPNNNNNFSTMNVSVEISLISFNINVCKRNLAFLQNLLNNHDIIYLRETWLLDSDIIFYFKNFTITHNIHHKADMLFPQKPVRPFGGRARNFQILNLNLLIIMLRILR